MKKILMLVIIISGSTFSGNGDSLTGVWQDMEVVAAGWSNTFIFFDDSTFKFFYSQMDHRKRETGFSGKYRVEGDGLYLEISERQYLEGGRLVEDILGKAGDSVLIEAVNKTLLFNPPEQMDMSISKIYSDSQFAMGKYIYLDAMKFFLMSTKPAEILKQFKEK